MIYHAVFVFIIVVLRVKNMNSASILFVISAASGTGKTTLLSRLLKEEKNIAQIITHTTRPMRPGEISGEDYHFVSKEIFDELQDKNLLVESAKVFGLDYGTAKASVDKACENNKDAIINIDYQGAQSFRKTFGAQVVSIFLLPPSWDVLEKRLRSRASDSEEVIQRRLNFAREEISHHGLFDYCLINDDLEHTLRNLKIIIEAERFKTARIQLKHQDLFERF